MTYREYHEAHPQENLSWCKPYTDESGDYWLIVHDGEQATMITPDDVMHTQNIYSPELEEFARKLAPDYDLYEPAVAPLYIALDYMHERGCALCPFFGECEVMSEEIGATDNRW